MPLDTSSFDMRRSFSVAPDLLWNVLTDPKHRESWGAPSEDMILVMETADLREGGHERHRCGPKDAPDFIVETRWYKLAPPDRAVFTETLLVGGSSIFTSLVTYVLDPTKTGTDLLLTVAVSSFEGADALPEVRDGWEGGLANLDRHIATLT